MLISDPVLMTENLSIDETGSVAPIFYIVSRKKMAILYIATAGLYGIYWFYKNWSNYKRRMSDKIEDVGRIWPVLRGVFSIFFTHALFREIKAYGYEKSAVAEWNNSTQASRLVLTMITSNVLDRMSYRSYWEPYSDIASLLILAVLLPQFLNVQDMINISCGDPDGYSNSRFTWANYAWIALGAVIWILALLGIYDMYLQ